MPAKLHKYINTFIITAIIETAPSTLPKRTFNYQSRVKQILKSLSLFDFFHDIFIVQEMVQTFIESSPLHALIYILFINIYCYDTSSTYFSSRNSGTVAKYILFPSRLFDYGYYFGVSFIWSYFYFNIIFYNNALNTLYGYWN